MNRGDKVAVCYDGKWGRRVPGIVTATRNGHHIRVRFKLYLSDDNEEVEVWFRVRRGWKPQAKYFGGWVAHENALMPRLFPAFGAPAPAGDWYSVFKWKE